MKFNLNLASRRYANKRALNHGFLAALCLLLLFSGWSIVDLMQENARLRQNEEAVSEASQQLRVLRGGPKKPLSPAERAELEKEHAVIKDLLDQDAFRWTALLDRMERLLPVGVSLSGFNPDFKKKSLSIRGLSRDLELMRKFLDQLEKNGDFKQVYIKNHARTMVKDYADNEREAISFSIQLEGVF